MLLSVLGDLEEVWGDVALQRVLLELPLQAMSLLSSNEVKVGRKRRTCQNSKIMYYVCVWLPCVAHTSPG